VALPFLQRLSIPVQLGVAPCNLLLSFITSRLMLRSAVPDWLLLVSLAALEVVEVAIVAGLEWGLRAQFRARVAGARRARAQ
jgi:hypothetical protein